MVSADDDVTGGGAADGTEGPGWSPTSTAITPGAAAAAAAIVHDNRRLRRSRQLTLASSESSSSGGSGGDSGEASSRAATSSGSSSASSAGMPLSSATASRHSAQVLRWASYCRRSSASSEPST